MAVDNHSRRFTWTRIAAAISLIVFVLGLPLPAITQTIDPSPASPAAELAPAAPAAPLPAVLPLETNEVINRLIGTMAGAEQSLARIKDLDQDIGRLRDDVEEVIATTTEVADGLRPRLAQVRSQIDRLGPPPEKGAPPEAESVATERARLTGEASALDGAIRTLELTWVRARQTIDKITDLRLAIFTRSLMERMSSPVFPAMWRKVIEDLPQVSRLLTYVTTDWWNNASRKPTGFFLVLAGALAAYLVLRRFVARLTRPRPREDRTPRSFFERAASAAWVAPARALPAVAAALIAYVGLDALDLLYYPSDRIAPSILRAVLIFVPVAALLAAVLAPDDPDRRLIPVSDRSARSMCRLLQGMAFVFATDLALTSIGRTLYLPLSMSVVQSLLASVAIAALLIGLLLTPFEPQDAPVGFRASRLAPRWLKLPLWLMAAGIVGACVLGYVALGRFMAQQLVMTGVVVLVATLLFLAIRAFTREPDNNRFPVGRMLESRFGMDASRRQQIARLTEVALTLTLAILALPVLLLQWGFSGDDIRDWLKAALFGFEIGQFRISLARILIAIVLFTLLLFVTRLCQRWMRQTMLLQPRVDPGIVNSVDTAVGYAGIAIAALLAVSYAGLDITNLAIVAGALSVGIGFGLQSIVNNFVSGLILLVERPIKVGDWIVVGKDEGNVRRISVRSTEIETFDRASLIVPNSELVTGRVLNWTHRNSLGRVVLKICVGHNTPPRKVSEILLQCAKSHPMVLQSPGPQVIFENFSTSGLEFSVRMQLSDITRGLDVQSELRTAIYDALRAANVEIPGAPLQAGSHNSVLSPPQADVASKQQD